MKNIIVEFAPQDHAIINYTNWEGITADRRIQPLHIWFGTTEYHKTPQFLLNAIDLDKDAERDFAMNDIHKINIFYNPLSREEWYYHPLSPQKEFFFTYPAGAHATVTEDFISGFNQRGTGSKVERLPTEEEARVACDAMELNELEKRMRKS